MKVFVFVKESVKVLCLSDHNKMGINMNNRTMEYGGRQNKDYVGGATFLQLKKMSNFWAKKHFELILRHSQSLQKSFKLQKKNEHCVSLST